MQEFWQVVVGITGISGVVSFVFFSLYKEWIKSPVLMKLTKDQLFKLMRLFLILTFLFGVVGLTLYGYQKSLANESVNKSSQQLKEEIKDRYAFGVKVFEEILNDPNITDEKKQIAGKIADEYEDYVESAIDALDKNQFNRWHDKSKNLIEMLESDATKSIIPDSRIRYRMAWEPLPNNNT